MSNVLPPPYETEGMHFEWDQLILGVESLNSHRKIIEDSWSQIIPELDKERDIDIGNPEEEAWFHLRRTGRENLEPEVRKYVWGRIEVLRLRKGSVSEGKRELIRLLFQNHGDMICTGWWPRNFEGRHDNAFLSFLQKLSVLRIRDGIFIDRVLLDAEADQVMRSPQETWSEPLGPWIEHIVSTRMGRNQILEYAHWFAHILSGWPSQSST